MPERMIKQVDGSDREARATAGASVGKRTRSEQIHASAQRGVAAPASALPYRDRIQQLFGRHDVSAVQAHTGAAATASARDMGAEAYATGDHVVLGDRADLHTVAHEAAHVVQQRRGVALAGGVGEAGDVHERHADAVADHVVRGESAEALLDAHAGSGGAAPAVQRAGGDGEADATPPEHELTNVKSTQHFADHYDQVIDLIAGLGEELATVLEHGAIPDDLEKQKERGDPDEAAAQAVELASALVAQQHEHVRALRTDLAALDDHIDHRRDRERGSERTTAKWLAAAALIVLATVMAFFIALISLSETSVWAGAGYGALAGLGMTMILGSIAAIRVLCVPTTADKEDLKLQPPILVELSKEVEARHKQYEADSVLRRKQVTARFGAEAAAQVPAYRRTRTIPGDLETGAARLPAAGVTNRRPTSSNVDHQVYAPDLES